VLTWSLVTVGGMPLEEFCRLRGVCLAEKEREELDRGVRRAAYSIIAGKGATYYGVGSALARVVEVILHDQRSILTVCSSAADGPEGAGLTYSLPRLVGGAGVLACFPPTLSAAEEQALRASAAVVRSAITELDLP
jgi:L-lactate dehydrogenase